MTYEAVSLLTATAETLVILIGFSFIALFYNELLTVIRVIASRINEEIMLRW